MTNSKIFTQPIIEMDLKLYVHSYSKNVSITIIPAEVCKIDRSMMYIEANSFKHPVIINNNHFTIPLKIKQLMKKNETPRIRLLPLKPEQGYFYFLGNFIINSAKKGKCYCLTIDRKIREILCLKERDIIEVEVNNNIFYTRVWWRTNRKSMLAFFPGRAFEMLGLKPSTPYQIKIKKSKKIIVSNEHLYSTNKLNLEFDKFLKNKIFNLFEFLKNSYATTEEGKFRKFIIDKINDEYVLVCYVSGGPISKKIKIKPTFKVNSEFFRVMGLIQAECSKSIKKTFCFTNETPENIEYIINWFEKYLSFPRELWLYELSVDSRIKNSDELKNTWASFLKISPNVIKTYSKKFNTKEPHKTGIMNLRSYGRTLKEVIMRLLECTKKYVSKNEEPAGYFLSGVLAGDGYVINTKEGSLNYVGISFDPNKNELGLYISCLKTLGIPNEDIKIYVNEHEKAKDFIKIASKYGIEIKVHKKGKSTKGFGSEINIFKFRSFKKLARFNPFFPNKANVEKFFSSFNKIDKTRVRFS